MFVDESGVSLLPAVRATWAPKGQTPVIRHRFSWSKMSMITALAFRSDGSEATMVFDLQDEAYDTETLIEFLEEFHDYFKGEKVTIPDESGHPFRTNPDTHSGVLGHLGKEVE